MYTLTWPCQHVGKFWGMGMSTEPKNGHNSHPHRHRRGHHAVTVGHLGNHDDVFGDVNSNALPIKKSPKIVLTWHATSLLRG